MTLKIVVLSPNEDGEYLIPEGWEPVAADTTADDKLKVVLQKKPLADVIYYKDEEFPEKMLS